jgi:endonuclease-3
MLNFENPFQLLVATALAAQCTDVAVNAATPELFAAWPTPAALAEAPLAEVERAVRFLTYFKSKAHNIKALSRQLTDKYNGVVPRTMEELIAFPGVGRKTGSVVLSTCFGVPAIIVDTHFSRVTRRLGFTASERPEEIEKNLAALMPREHWIAVSHVLNRFGRAVCHARRPECDKCPVNGHCREKQAHLSK